MNEPLYGSLMDRVLSEKLPNPENGWIRGLARSPIFLWRLGLGRVVGRSFLVLTHIGRRSGKVRRTALEYSRLDDRLLVFNPWPQADWYQNILAEPRVTVQTDQGAISAEARPLQSHVEYIEAFRLVERSPLLQMMLQVAGIEVSLHAFLAAKDRLPVVAFEPAEVQAPPPLKADLKWLTPVVLAAVGLGYLAGRGELAARKPKPWYKKLLNR